MFLPHLVLCVQHVWVLNFSSRNTLQLQRKFYIESFGDDESYCENRVCKVISKINEVDLFQFASCPSAEVKGNLHYGTAALPNERCHVACWM